MMTIDTIRDPESSRFAEINQYNLDHFEVIAMINDSTMSRSFGNNSGVKTFKTLKGAYKAANQWVQS